VRAGRSLTGDRSHGPPRYRCSISAIRRELAHVAPIIPISIGPSNDFQALNRMHEMRREDRAGIAETVVDFRISRTIA
jgi:hypothetical protein